MFLRALEFIENIALWVACTALFVMGSIVMASVVGRGVFNHPVPDDLLMIGLLMVCVIVLPLAYVERGDGHISVTVVTNFFPERLQALLTAFGNLLFGLFLGTMGYFIAKKIPSEISQNLYYDGQLDVPTWPMKIVFAIGVTAFVLRLSVSIFQNLRRAFGPAPQD